MTNLGCTRCIFSVRATIHLRLIVTLCASVHLWIHLTCWLMINDLASELIHNNSKGLFLVPIAELASRTSENDDAVALRCVVIVAFNTDQIQELQNTTNADQQCMPPSLLSSPCSSRRHWTCSTIFNLPASPWPPTQFRCILLCLCRWHWGLHSYADNTGPIHATTWSTLRRDHGPDCSGAFGHDREHPNQINGTVRKNNLKLFQSLTPFRFIGR